MAASMIVHGWRFSVKRLEPPYEPSPTTFSLFYHTITLLGVFLCPISLASGLFKSRLLPLPTPGKGEKAGTPHTPPRGCRPLEPCFAQLLHSPGLALLFRVYG